MSSMLDEMDNACASYAIEFENVSTITIDFKYTECSLRLKTGICAKITLTQFDSILDI